MGGPGRGSLFLPPASSVGPGGVHPPAGATMVRGDTVEPPSDANTPFGTRQPYVAGRTDGTSRVAVGESVPRLGDEPAGGSSGRAPHGSLGGLFSLGPELQDAIADAVRSKIARSLPVTPGSVWSPIARPDPRRSGHTQSRRRLHYASQSSDGEYSGGDFLGGGSRRRTPRVTPRHRPVHASGSALRVPVPWRDRSEERPTGLVRIVPEKITVNTPHSQDLFDCETYALENKSVSYTRAHAHTMGPLKKDVMHSFGHRSKWNGDAPHKVFQFLRKFCKACDDNDGSEGEAFYMLQDFTLEPLRSQVMAVMPTRRCGNPGEVSSYLKLVNWVIRMPADESTVAGLVEQFHQKRQEEKEDEMSYAERLRVLNTSCGFLHSTGALKGRYVEGVYPVVLATLRERNTQGITLAELSRIDRTRGDEYRWMQTAQQKERAEEAAKLAEATRLRRQARAVVSFR